MHTRAFLTKAIIFGVIVLAPKIAAATEVLFFESGSWPGYARGAANDVAIIGNHAFVALAGGIAVEDISDPANPKSTSFLSTGGSPQRLIPYGNYILEVSGFVRICDFSDIRNPRLGATLAISERADDGVVVGSHVLLTTEIGLAIVDLSNPATPRSVSSLAVGTRRAPRAIAANGSTAYLASLQAGLSAIDFSDLTKPVLLGTVDTPGIALDVDVAGTFAYVADSTSGLQVVNLANPTNLQIVGNFDTIAFNGTSALRVHVSGNRAYVTDGAAGHIIDVSDPALPRRLGDYNPISGAPRNVVVSGNHLYAAFGTRTGTNFTNYGLQIIDVSDPANARWLSGRGETGSGNSGEIVGDLVYMADGNSLRILDAKNPTQIRELGKVNVAAREVAVANNHAFVAAGTNGLRVIDISSRTNPIDIGGSLTAGEARDIAISGNLAFVAEDTPVIGMEIFDLSNPALLQRVGAWTTNMGYVLGNTVAASGQYAFFGGGSPGVFILDVSNPAEPQFVTRLLTGSPYDLEVIGNLLFVAATEGGQIYDISNMAAIRELGRFPVSPGSLALSQKYFYLANSTGIRAARQLLPDPEYFNSAIVGSFASDYAKIKVSGQRAYLFNSRWGLRVLELFEDGRLGTRKNGDAWELFWPRSQSGWRLEKSSTLNPPSWSTTTNIPVTTNTEWRAPGTEGFYRLTLPPP